MDFKTLIKSRDVKFLEKSLNMKRFNSQKDCTRYFYKTTKKEWRKLASTVKVKSKSKKSNSVAKTKQLPE